MSRLTDRVIDRGVLPDPVLRAAIRGLLRRRLASATRGGAEAAQERKRALVARLRSDHQPVAVDSDVANEQHYEVPAELYQHMLGARLKYSSSYFPSGEETLDQAERAMLALTCRRAELVDGQDVLELGCGWGSLTLWVAEQYPNSRITAVSNSHSQREYIAKQAAQRGLDNVTVLTADVAVLDLPTRSFDRVVSVEMFEHVRNHRVLFERIATWLRPGGRLFVHVFAHRQWPYLFETGGRGDWMARNFFTGGIMPSDDWFLLVQDALVLDDHWVVDGRHYARTCRAWLDNLDDRRGEVEAIFADAYGRDAATAWVNRWRVFTMACEELFAFRGGSEWYVSHSRFRKP